ncbi:unnamed protein product [Angiostrongylus costaricensis]|uniref:Uncharacterized protein n=1 Tax=Angiostrongylus costaricensis TaxID=334426 RepID=A0A3P7HMJ6_ANGCS|nr:unnamed protein product [Angiostrongylus costaricensis]
MYHFLTNVHEDHFANQNHVTLLYANHCASTSGDSVFSTRDFRADKRLLCCFENDSSFSKLENTNKSNIMECVKMLNRDIAKLHRRNILITVLWLRTEETLEQLSKDYSEVTLTRNERLVVSRLGGLNEGEFQEHIDNELHTLTKIKNPKVFNEIIKENLITISYSEHFSWTEIFEFLLRLRFKLYTNKWQTKKTDYNPIHYNHLGLNNYGSREVVIRAWKVMLVCKLQHQTPQ